MSTSSIQDGNTYHYLQIVVSNIKSGFRVVHGTRGWYTYANDWYSVRDIGT